MPATNYDTALAAWRQQHGSADAGAAVAPADVFLAPGSELAATLLPPERRGDRVFLANARGWAASFAFQDLRAFVAQNGPLCTWEDFARLNDSAPADAGTD